MSLATMPPAPRFRIPGVTYPSDDEARRWLDVGAWLPSTVGEMVERAARERPTHSAIVDDLGRVTWEEVGRWTRSIAADVLARGLNPGDRVLVQLGISRYAAVWVLGLARAGVIPVCAVARYRDREMGGLAEKTEARAHIVEPGTAGDFDLLALGERLAQANAALDHVIVADRLPSEPATVVGEEPAPSDVAVFQLSGGTTGVPKVIPRFHAEYLGYAQAWADRMQIREDDVLLWSLPLTHNAGMLMFLLPALIHGATLVLQSRFEAEAFLAAVERERVTVTGSIGPIAPRLLDHPDPGRFDLSSLRVFLTLNRAEELERHLGVRTATLFGITEGILSSAGPEASSELRHRTAGWPASPHDEFRVAALGPGRPTESATIGELVFRGPSTVKAYFRDTDATAQAFTSDGWFRTGDLVSEHVVEEQRCFAFEGRAKDNIDRGGEKFGTVDIEALLDTHPAVKAACVVGMPDRYLGERVCAFVVLEGGEAALTVEEASTFLLAHGLAKFKVPERIETLDALPTTAVGKLDRPALRRRIAGTLAAEETA